MQEAVRNQINYCFSVGNLVRGMLQLQPKRFCLAGLQEAVRNQIDYYFSVGNLVRDVFLRSKMNGEGWIPCHVVASFNRVRMLTPDIAIIIKALEVRGAA